MGDRYGRSVHIDRYGLWQVTGSIVLQFENPFGMIERRRFAGERHRLECHVTKASSHASESRANTLPKVYSLCLRLDVRLIFPVPRSRKINLEWVLASLNTTCLKCGFTITPDLVKRLDFEWMECPKCGERFQPKANAS